MTEHITTRHLDTRPGAGNPTREEFTRTTTPQKPFERLAVLIAGFLVAVGMLVLFSVLAEDVATHQAIVLDNQANSALHQYTNPNFDTAMNTASLVGSAYVLVPLVLLVVIALIVTRRKRTATFLAVAAVGGALLNEVLKQSFARARPNLPWATKLTTYSFPSGHSMESLVCYIALALVVWRVFGRRWGAFAVVLASLLVLTIGISRIYLGAHYFSDVVGGYAAGTFWVSGAATATAGRRRFPQWRSH